MRYSITILSLTFPLLFTSSAFADQPNQDSTKAISISSISAHLYFHHNATFDSRDLLAQRLALWNSVIGEGDAGHPTDMVLVKVAISGSGLEKVQQGLSLQVVAKAGRSIIVKKSYSLSGYVINPGDTQITLPVLLDGISCSEVKFTATLRGGKGKLPTKTVTLPFECGE